MPCSTSSNYGVCKKNADCCSGLMCKRHVLLLDQPQGACLDIYYGNEDVWLPMTPPANAPTSPFVPFNPKANGDGIMLGESNIITGRSAAGGDLSDNKEENGLMNGMLIDPVIACGLVIIMILVFMIKRVLFSTSN